MATNFKISAAAKAAALNNVTILQQPSATSGGTQLVNQELAAAFEAAGEAGKSVRLVEYVCNDLTENRTRSFTPEGWSEKITTVRKDSAQQTGLAKIEVEIGGVKSVFEGVKMHSPVALGFVGNDTQVLIGSTGIISMGRNKDKKWLSLRLPVALSVQQMTDALNGINAAAPVVPPVTAAP